MSWLKGAATPSLPCGIPGSRAGKDGTGKDGSGAPKVTQQGHASMEGLFVLLRTAPPLGHDSLHTPILSRVPTTAPFPAPSLRKARPCLLYLGTGAKAYWGKAVHIGSET